MTACVTRWAAAAATGILLATMHRAAAAPPSDPPGTRLGSGYLRTWSDRDPSDVRPPVAAFVSDAAARQAAPTNQWYSSVLFERWSHPIHAHPMTYRAGEGGFELGLPTRTVVANKGLREIDYDHVAALTVSLDGIAPHDARLSRSSDWLAEFSLADHEGRALKATVLHGSPFSYLEAGTATVRFHLRAAPRLLVDPARAHADSRVAELVIDAHPYAIFAPTGSTWTWLDPTDLIVHLPAKARYLSVAGLPDERRATLADFLEVAYAFPVDTRVDWSYDRPTGAVRSTFHVRTVAKEGKGQRTLMGLYPHQWRNLERRPTAKYTYDTVRGTLRLISGNDFATRLTFHGVLPYWGGLAAPAARAELRTLMTDDLATSESLFTRFGVGPYWTGKALGAVAQLANIAEAEGETAMRDAWLAQLKRHLEAGFDGRHGAYFAVDRGLGTVLGFPQEFNSVRNMNDHHFHYGYWILAAAQVALRDPEWASRQRWGAMVEQLVADIATADRGRRDFPFLRNFDVYEGHSWASGLADRPGGNNQESSSEAVNAWAGLILWGEAIGSMKLRDLGVYLYTTEISAISEYWFDLHHENFAPEYGKRFAALVFGGNYGYNTWWTQEPRQVSGINLLPLTPASTYLGSDPTYVHALVAALPGAAEDFRKLGLSSTTPADIWQDVFASYAALGDPAAGLALWNRQGTVESGETRSHTFHWLSSLQEMGTPDFTVTADASLYAVFRTADGVRTYLAYNPRSRPMRVTFSTGMRLEVAPRSLARAH